MRTLTGDCTSSEDVAEAWSLSPSDPIFKSSCTISGSEDRGRRADQLRSRAPGTPSPVEHTASSHTYTQALQAAWSPSGEGGKAQEGSDRSRGLSRGGGAIVT